jgi:hypothetical protein
MNPMAPGVPATDCCNCTPESNTLGASPLAALDDPSGFIQTPPGATFVAIQLEGRRTGSSLQYLQSRDGTLSN